MLTAWFDPALHAAAGWPVPAVLAIAGLILAIESGTLFGLLLPGSTLLVGLGLWAHLAPGSIGPAAATAAVSTVTGACLGWYQGRAEQHRTGTRAARARSWFAGRGPLATVALLASGHWAAAARPLTPRVAGGAGVPFALAGPVLLVSGTAWAVTLVLLGHQLGPAVLGLAGWAPVVGVALLVGWLVVRSRRHENRLTRLSTPPHTPPAASWSEHTDR